VDINPLPRPTNSLKWDAFVANGSSWNNGYRSSHTNGDETSFVEWQVPLAAGTWTLEVTHANGPDAAILSVYLNAGTTPVGTVDAYAPAIEPNEHGVISDIEVGSSGMHTIRVRTETKNPLSSNFSGYLVWLRLVKQ
jgi:hypothetical protein